MIDSPAERAAALAGTRFRAQGRDPALGLDCVGLVIHAHHLPADAFRRDYRLRGDHRQAILGAVQPFFRRVARRRSRPGDVLLCQVGPDQVHLSVETDIGFVHADARLGKVVETPGKPPWPILVVLRRRSRPARERRG